jgi:hypothetical protein
MADNMSKIFIGRPAYYIYPYGSKVSKVSSTFGKFAQFLKLSKLLEERLFVPSFKDHIRTLRSMMSIVCESVESILDNIRYMQDLLDVVSASPLCNPISSTKYDKVKDNRYPFAPEIPRKVFRLAPAMVSSFAIVTRLDNLDPEPLDSKDILEGLYLAGYLDELTDRYTYAQKWYKLDAYDALKFLKFKEFSHSDRVDFTMRTIDFKAPSDLSSNLGSELKNRKGFGFKLKTRLAYRTKYFEIRDSLRELVDNQCTKFGFVMSAELCWFSTRKGLTQGVRTLLPLRNIDDQVLSGSYDFTQNIKKMSFHDIIKMLSVGKFSKMITDNWKIRCPLRFKMPFNFELKKYFLNPKAEEYLPFEVNKHSRAVTLGTVYQYYDLLPEYVYVDYKPPILFKAPVVFPGKKNCSPFSKSRYSQVLRRFIGMRERITSNVTWYSVDELFKKNVI